MKMSQRDKMILLGFLSVLIVIAGIFGLIRPKMKEIDDHEGELAEVRTTWEGIDAKIQQIGPLQDDIKATYADSKELFDDFLDVTKVDSTFELDQFMQPYVDECNLEANTVELGATTTTELGYYYFVYDVLSSSMFDAADVNGNYQAQIDELTKEGNSLSERNEETVIVTQYGFSAEGKKEDIWKFMEKIESLKTTILIDSVNISDYTFGEEEAEGQTVRPEDAKSEVTFVISLYSVFEMDEPVVD